jgi:hypothetical protein
VQLKNWYVHTVAKLNETIGGDGIKVFCLENKKVTSLISVYFSISGFSVAGMKSFFVQLLGTLTFLALLLCTVSCGGSDDDVAARPMWCQADTPFF